MCPHSASAASTALTMCPHSVTALDAALSNSPCPCAPTLCLPPCSLGHVPPLSKRCQHNLSCVPILCDYPPAALAICPHSASAASTTLRWSPCTSTSQVSIFTAPPEAGGQGRVGGVSINKRFVKSIFPYKGFIIKRRRSDKEFWCVGLPPRPPFPSPAVPPPQGTAPAPHFCLRALLISRRYSSLPGGRRQRLTCQGRGEGAGRWRNREKVRV